ncbi:MAG: hypothetical protein GZ085_07750 [Sulfuriferula multivorans]|uniref:Cell envelope biogenesis protein TolA n=1 Tax=Sulfuriferula multivorans TaxID=1559896 RepID=A0A7C9JX16_9PROT|nr:hypothetical protein [Sulfuriferula multivorans]
MNTIKINAIALAVSLVFSAGAMAQTLSKDDYKAGMDKISAEYKLAKVSCSPLSGNAKDICKAEAKGRDQIALADLELRYEPNSENHYKASVAKAEAVYAVAIERCDDKAGNAKDVCVKQAKAAEIGAKADAKAQMKALDANATAYEKSAVANDKATEKAVDAYKDANADKLAAQYQVAKEKCDAYAGNTKEVCVKEAKVRFSQ